MGAFNTLRAEFANHISRMPIEQVNSFNLTFIASEYADRLAPCMYELAMVGPDFLYGRGYVNMSPNHTWESYVMAATHVGSERLEQLSASAGAINIGIYHNRLVLKHAWQVCGLYSFMSWAYLK